MVKQKGIIMKKRCERIDFSSRFIGPRSTTVLVRKGRLDTIETEDAYNYGDEWGDYIIFPYSTEVIIGRDGYDGCSIEHIQNGKKMMILETEDIIEYKDMLKKFESGKFERFV